ncbi:MAG: putative anti-sigma factor [Phycisphaerales bacterium]|nr:putative anti-sigma factor [Phycisphaerales bacterium]
MNCEQRRDLMPLLLVDGLEPAEAAALRAHLAGGCTRCAAYLAEADATLAYLPYALEPVAPAAAAREQLMDRIAQHVPVAAHLRNAPPARRGRGGLRMPAWVRKALPAAVAACVTFIVTAKYMIGVQHTHDDVLQKQLVKVQGEASSRDQRNRELVTQTELLQSPSLRLIRMDGVAQPKASARALWDARRQAWHFYAYNLDTLGPKEAYELWFVTPYGRKVPAITFRPNELGNAYVVTSLDKDVGPVAGAFVTDEPSVGTMQPTGSTHLSGKLE